PSYFTTAALGNPTATRDFLDIFNARIYALFYDALKKYRLATQAKAAARGDAPDYLACLAGLGAPAPASAAAVDSMVPFAAVIRALVRNAEGLVRLVAERFPGAPVSLVENVPRWIALEDRPRLGSGALLGGNALLGTHLLDVSGRFRIVIGPVGWAQFER